VANAEGKLLGRLSKGDLWLALVEQGEKPSGDRSAE